MSSSVARPSQPPRRRALLRRWVPARGLRDEDWAGRHRLLTGVLVLSTVLLTVVGSLTGALQGVWLGTVAVICGCTIGALVLPPRRLPSMCVALGLTVACAGLVSMTHGLTESHFTFFVAVAALALYRDWAPFGVFLSATVAHHLLAGLLVPEDTFGHPGARHHVLLWALVHGAAVLAAAVWQIVAWRLAEVEELRADADLSASRAQFEVSFDETPVPMALLSPQGRLLRVNGAYRRWMGIPQIPADGLPLTQLPITPIGPPLQPPMPIMERLLAGTPGGEPIEQVFRHDDGRIMHVEMHGAPVRDRQGGARLVVAHCLDVTE